LKPVDTIRLNCTFPILGREFLFMRIIAPVLGAFQLRFSACCSVRFGLIVILLAWRVRWDFKGKLRAAMFAGHDQFRHSVCDV